MISKSFAVAMGAGLLLVAIFVGLIVLKQRGSTPRLVGEITDVRTLGMDESSSVAIVDFRFVNDSRLPFIVLSTEMSAIDNKGQPHNGTVIASTNTDELFQLFPALGTKKASTLIIKNRIPAGGARESMLAARFEIPKSDLDARQKIILRILEVDGSVSELSR